MHLDLQSIVWIFEGMLPMFFCITKNKPQYWYNVFLWLYIVYIHFLILITFFLCGSVLSYVEYIETSAVWSSVMRSLDTRSCSFRVILNHCIYHCTYAHSSVVWSFRRSVSKWRLLSIGLNVALASLADKFSLLSSVVLFLCFKWHSESYFKTQCIFSSCYQQSRNDFYKREYFLIFRNSLA